MVIFASRDNVWTCSFLLDVGLISRGWNLGAFSLLWCLVLGWFINASSFFVKLVIYVIHKPIYLFVSVFLYMLPQKSPLCIYSYTCFDNILNKYNLFTDMLPQHLVCKNELNCEYCNMSLQRNNKAPWWWSDKIETCRSDFKCL